MKSLNAIRISGRETLPLVEGGKGIAVSNGESSGAWSACGGVGTFSGVNADFRDDNGEIVDMIYHGKSRRDRHDELVAFAIKGGIHQAQVAHDLSGGQGAIHMNVLWEMGGCERILHGILEGAKGMVHGVTCGAGMPYKLAQLCAQYGSYYYPIVSSARAFQILWKRAYHRFPEFLGGVVYEDPWRAGGHNGLSNVEDPKVPEDPYPRVVALRKAMNDCGLTETPIFMAGGVWRIDEWEDWLDNTEVGPVAFQFGTRPLLTQESPISNTWKRRLPTLREGEIYLNRFSPTGFYSSAVENSFLLELKGRNERQVAYSTKPDGDQVVEYAFGPRGRAIYLTPQDLKRVEAWVAAGFTEQLKTPDSTVVFVTPEKSRQIRSHQVGCMGCLSQCRFSNWKNDEGGTTGKKPDPRSFCIQKTLQQVSHSEDIETQLMFAGHNAYRFASDPWYANGFVPTVAQLMDRLQSGQ